MGEQPNTDVTMVGLAQEHLFRVVEWHTVSIVRKSAQVLISVIVVRGNKY